MNRYANAIYGYELDLVYENMILNERKTFGKYNIKEYGKIKVNVEYKNG